MNEQTAEPTITINGRELPASQAIAFCVAEVTRVLVAFAHDGARDTIVRALRGAEPVPPPPRPRPAKRTHAPARTPAPAIVVPSPREAQTLALFRSGKTIAEVTATLGVSRGAVHALRHQLKRKGFHLAAL